MNLPSSAKLSRADMYAGISAKTLRNQIGQADIPTATLRKILEGFEKYEQVKVFKGINVGSCTHPARYMTEIQ